MTPFVAELTGTALLIILGDGVVANVVLNKTKGNNGGLISITFGWAIAVFVAVYATAAVSGAHLNPAVTVALASIGKFDWALVPGYLLAQLLGAMLGAFLVWLVYRQHFNGTEDADTKRAVFCTGPAIKNPIDNILSELIGTFVFILAVLFITKSQSSLGALDALPVALLVLGIGLSLGGTTGYAINPARDLGPRIMHTLLPIHNKGGSDWWYAWIPVVGPLVGAVLAAWVYQWIA
ncbi:MAG: aquaporin family protein [Chitinophagaceae bacterium]|nr:aquaporin family protein [Chitinophagaceae bacterium]MCA6453693.1 aquaporin family protein [Chitinophagaceae bacterium]MCA6456973.1 aquaporin family protein [Chitinophagaceae bacterium]MCA6459622.1 aquaporin family protein [Chitinophagaceae bacterium]MCA6464489.1 aquaporin family protein [Chitinophagaceae bacterium]